MTDVCKRICFDQKAPDSLIFVDADLVLRYNFLTGKKEKIFDFICDFTEQPEFFIFNEDQTVCIITTDDDTLMLDFETRKEYDLDEEFGISDIKNVLFFEDQFFILANKQD